MKKTLALLLGATTIALAGLQPTPSDVQAPAAPLVERPSGITGFAFCPQWRGDGAIESDLRGIPAADSRVAASWWNGDSFSVALAADRVGTVASNVRQGVVPVMLESTEPVAFGVRSEGVVGRASSGCASWPAGSWVVGVGGSLEGETTTLMVMNPFPQAATIDINVYSEQGLEVVESLEAFTVPSGESREINLSDLLRLRTHLVVVIDDPDLLTFSAIATQREGVTGIAVAEPLAEQWYFPSPPPGTVAEVVVVNPSAVAITIDIDHFGVNGGTLSVEQFALDKRSSVIIPVPEGVAMQVRADGDVGATMRAASDSGLGIMTGIRIPALSWALPGASVIEELVGISITNPGPSVARATYRFVGAGASSPPSEVDVAAGASVYFEVRASGSRGMLIEADVPVVVAWSTVGEDHDLILDSGIAR